MRAPLLSAIAILPLLAMAAGAQDSGRESVPDTARPGAADDAEEGARERAAGERLFRQRCAACHSVVAGQNRVGPSLAGLMGRKAGSLAGARYSQGMRALAFSWDAARLDTYLADPRALVPGTTMTVAVPNAAERAGILAYLAALPAPD